MIYCCCTKYVMKSRQVKCFSLRTSGSETTSCSASKAGCLALRKMRTSSPTSALSAFVRPNTNRHFTRHFRPEHEESEQEQGQARAKSCRGECKERRRGMSRKRCMMWYVVRCDLLIHTHTYICTDNDTAGETKRRAVVGSCCSLQQIKRAQQ